MNIAVAIIEHPHNGMILITQRGADMPQAHFWEFPGGKCLPGETLQQCVVRQAQESFEVEVTITKEWPCITHLYPALTVNLFPFYCHAESANLRPGNNRNAAWVNLVDLEEYPFAESLMPLVERLRWYRRDQMRPILPQDLAGHQA